MNDLTPHDLGVRSKLLVEKHVEYIRSFSKIWENTDKIEFVATEHFWMSGMYWGLTAMALLGRLHEMDQEAIITWVLSCQHSNGGFGGSHRNDPHMLYTLSAVQILALYDKLDLIDEVQVMKYVKGLQQADGSFTGDEWGEVDTRFTYCAFLAASILGRLHELNVTKAVDFIASCKNFDGGFGCTPGCVNDRRLAVALMDGQRSSKMWVTGGSNSAATTDITGEHVCYSWWCLSCLSILGRMHWVDNKALSNFILFCQDEEDGGISDRPEDMADVYHTFFGIAGLSLMGYPDLQGIDPTWALPVDVVQRIVARRNTQQG